MNYIRIIRWITALCISMIFSVANAQKIENDEHLTPQVREFLQGLNSSSVILQNLAIPEARKVLEKVQSSITYDYSGVKETVKSINIEDGRNIKLNIMRPRNSKGVLPAFIFVHGGGWVIGDYATHRRLIRDLVLASGAAAVTVDYSRTPDAVFPVALNEVYSSTNWVFNHANELGIDFQRIGMVGNSAGGNMAAVVSRLLKDSKGADLKAVVLMWPLLDTDLTTSSYKQYGKDRYATTPLLQWMLDLYVKDKNQLNSINVSPLKVNINELKGLPPTLIQVAENDVLRDEGEAYGRKLSAAGVKAVTVRYNGVIHDWGLLNPLSEIPETKALIKQTAEFLKKNL